MKSHSNEAGPERVVPLVSLGVVRFPGLQGSDWWGEAVRPARVRWMGSRLKPSTKEGGRRQA